MARIFSIDFDGVLHSYTSGWKGEDVIPDPPVGGAIAWLERLAMDERVTVCIYSSRSASITGREAMRNWLLQNGISEVAERNILFPTSKPAAFISIDDRGWRFDGTFPDADVLLALKTWQGK